jgi:hypothetical protein
MRAVFPFTSLHSRRHRGDGRDDLGGVPLGVKPARRDRGRRGGPRTPLPLLPVIAICAGIGLAYVSQSAHATQATYEATSLTAAQQELRAQNQRLGDDLGRLASSARVVAAARQIGMVPAGTWSYVAAAPEQVLSPSKSELASVPPQNSDALAALIGVISGAFVGNGGR